MGLLGPPNQYGRQKRLPALQQKKKLSEERRLRLEALKRKAQPLRKYPEKARQEMTPLEVKAVEASPAGGPNPPEGEQKPGSQKPGSRGEKNTTTQAEMLKPPMSRKASASDLPMDWRTLAACGVVLDRENEVAKKKRQEAEVARMRLELAQQLESNGERRKRERKEKLEWMAEVRRQAEVAAEQEREEARKLRDKKLKDRKTFDEQARAREKTVALERDYERQLDAMQLEAARKSLLSEERRVQREKDKSKARQASLRSEIDRERALKAEKRRLQWEEEARINREAIERADEMERRRVKALEQREAAIQGRQRIHAESTGAEEKAVEDRERELTERYLAQKAKEDAADERRRLERLRQANERVKAENDFQMARRKAEKDAEMRARAEERLRMKAAADALKREEDAEKKRVFLKQREFQRILHEQKNLVQARKKQEAVCMTSDERALNRGFVNQILAKPDRKQELVDLVLSPRP